MPLRDKILLTNIIIFLFSTINKHESRLQLAMKTLNRQLIKKIISGGHVQCSVVFNS